MEFECKICGNKNDNQFYTVREMQFGMRDKFIYCECPNCGCLQIVNPPEDLSKYYPKEYFSFQIHKEKYLKQKLNIYRDRYSFGLKSKLGKILFKKFGEPTYIGWLNKTGVGLDSKILDVGCGSGKLLYRMGNTGFKNLTGIDAFIEKDIHYNNGVNIFKKNLNDINKKFDLIMMHHSLEHLEDQHGIFNKLSSLLNKGKFLLIRIPICSSYSWKTYRENWFALDAPRHFYNHSLKSMKFLADKYGFEIVHTSFDSRSIQFWGSEQYQKDIPLMDERSYFVNPNNSFFSKEQIDNFERKTERLNKNGEGDQAVLFIKKI
ncbi:MAG: class I SAM-dependent methyltransferase [Ignavibacteriaceae bacterium]